MKPMMQTRLPKYLLLFLMVARPVGAGQLWLGIKGGVPLTNPFNSASPFGSLTTNLPGTIFTSSNNRYTMGPTVELHLPAGLGIEMEALYRHFSYSLVGSVGKDYCCLVFLLVTSRTTGGSWEFPLLLKYRFATRITKPYLVAGLAIDTLSGLTTTTVSTIVPFQQTTTLTTSNPGELKDTTTTGFVSGVGTDLHAIGVHITPEIRYTRWGAAHFATLDRGRLSNPNQLEFLVGITFNPTR
jgi:hypothetical protein